MDSNEYKATSDHRIMQKFVICPKHGEHSHVVHSTIKGHEGVWCMICLLEKLGDSLPYVEKPWSLELSNETTST